MKASPKPLVLGLLFVALPAAGSAGPATATPGRTSRALRLAYVLKGTLGLPRDALRAWRQRGQGATPSIDGVIDRVFGGQHARYRSFKARLEQTLPTGTRVAVFGSALTGAQWGTQHAFDRAGQGTSDLDLVLIGKGAFGLWHKHKQMVPRLLTWPLNEHFPRGAPALETLREQLSAALGRPLSLEAARFEWVLAANSLIRGVPYRILE